MVLIPNEIYYQEIKVQTSKKRDIPNRQYFEIAVQELRQYSNLAKKYPRVKIRNAPNPLYNCHGFTFASSRTGIDSEFIDDILKDDDYKQIIQKDILPGDIIIYKKNGAIIHTGIVISEPDKIGLFYVISKWGSYSECIHLAIECPYSPADLEFYRKQ